MSTHWVWHPLVLALCWGCGDTKEVLKKTSGSSRVSGPSPYPLKCKSLKGGRRLDEMTWGTLIPPHTQSQGSEQGSEQNWDSHPLPLGGLSVNHGRCLESMYLSHQHPSEDHRPSTNSRIKQRPGCQ